MPFDAIVGHERVKDVLYRLLDRGRLPPSLLFAGPEGVGKRALAFQAARGLLCERGGPEPCGACIVCSRIERGLHPDVEVVEPDGNFIKIERIRQLVASVLSRPFEGRARAFVVDQAHAMTEEAANSLLKALEEPPATSHLLLVTASPQALLPTIRSRCQCLRFGALSVSEIEDYLKSRQGVEPGEARMRALMSGGSLALALAFESEAFKSLRDLLLAQLEQAPEVDVVERLMTAERLADQEDPALVLTVLRSLLRDMAVLHVGADSRSLVNRDVEARLDALARGRLGARAEALFGLAGETRHALVKRNANRLLAWDRLAESLGSDAEVA